MIADTTFLGDLLHEQQRGQHGPASHFLTNHRADRILTTVISAGELAVLFHHIADARNFLDHYRILRLSEEVAYMAAELDRELMRSGGRLGENDNWIAGFCRYYGQALISRDLAFDRVRGLRRLAY